MRQAVGKTTGHFPRHGDILGGRSGADASPEREAETACIKDADSVRRTLIG